MSKRYGRKKRPKRFQGTAIHKMPRLDPAPEAEAEEITVRSASSKKLLGPYIEPTQEGFTSGDSSMLLRRRKQPGGSGCGDPTSGGPSEEDSWVMKGHRWFDCENVLAFIDRMKCPDCSSPMSVTEDSSCRRGHVTRMPVTCTKCDFVHYLADSYDSRQTGLNTQSVLAARMIGKGQKSLETFCAVMDLPPPVQTPGYTKCSKVILEASSDAVQAEFLASADQLRAMSVAGTLFVPSPLVEQDSDSDCGSEGADEAVSQGGDADVPSHSDQGEAESSFEDDEESSCNGSNNDDQSDDGQSCDDQSALCSDEDLSVSYLGRVWSSEPLDITVTFDGTWSKRGFTAIYGVVVVVSWDTGRVLDTHVLCKNCIACARKRSQHPETSQAFIDWYAIHEDRCTANHSGSSPAMERDGALILWGRSVERLNLRYTTVVSDADSKTISALNREMPYGRGVKIVKHECVGHVQKRVGKEFIKLRTNPPVEIVKVLVKKAVPARKATKKRPAVPASSAVYKDESQKVQIGGIGGITKSKYLLLQQFYGNAIRANAGKLEDMVNSCWAVFYHTISTDSVPQHDHCPKGPLSWCFHNRAVALNEKPRDHKPDLDPKRLIPLRLAKYVKPIFERLCRRSLLEKCVLSATQNQNESFNNVVWNRCSKTDFSSPVTVETAVNLAVLTFNGGMSSLTSVLERLHQQPGPLCTSLLHARDVCRVKRADTKASIGEKKKRKSEQRRKAAAEEQRISAEGVTYEPGVGD